MPKDVRMILIGQKVILCNVTAKLHFVSTSVFQNRYISQNVRPCMTGTVYIYYTTYCKANGTILSYVHTQFMVPILEMKTGPMQKQIY